MRQDATQLQGGVNVCVQVVGYSRTGGFLQGGRLHLHACLPCRASAVPKHLHLCAGGRVLELHHVRAAVSCTLFR